MNAEKRKTEAEEVISKEDLEELSRIKHYSKKLDEEDDITLPDLVDLSKNYIYLITIFAAIVISYYPILDNKFVWDDNVFIVSNEIISLKNIPSFFANDVEGLYRPMRSVFYAISYALFGLNPLYYHLQAILIHLIVSILVYYILMKLTDSRFISFAAALIFAVHPIHTESIAFITSSFDQIAIIFLLLSFYYYIKTSKPERFHSMDWYYLSLAFFAFAAFASEIALTLPFLIILYDWFFSGKDYKHLKPKIRYYAPYLAILVSYLIIRFFFIGVITRVVPSDTHNYFLTLVTMSKVILVYIYLLIFPKNLAIERTVPLAPSPIELGVIISVIAIMIIGFLAYYLRNKNKLATFSIFLFFITLLPVLNIIPIQRIIAETYLYLPSLGFVIIAALAINYLLKKILEKKRESAVFIVIILVIPYIILTVNRNDIWQDEFTLWSNAVKDSPYSSKTHLNFAIISQERKDYNSALTHYLISLQLNPNRYQTYFNLATLYEEINQKEKAVEAYNVSLILNPKFADAHNNLGLLYSKLNQSELALKHLKLSLELEPNNPRFHLNLGSHYNYVNQLDLALQEFREALELSPNTAEAHYNIGIIYIKQKRYEDAEYEMLQALSINPKLVQARLALEDLKKIAR